MHNEFQFKCLRDYILSYNPLHHYKKENENKKFVKAKTEILL